MTKEEAKKFGLDLLHGIMERNESYPVYANNVKLAIDALSEESGSSEIPNDHEGLDEAAEKFVGPIRDEDDIDELARHSVAKKAVKFGAEWAFGQGSIVRGWIARHKNGELCLFWNKPEYKINLGWVDEHQHWKVIDPSLFSEIKMKDSPVEVIVQIRKQI